MLNFTSDYALNQPSPSIMPLSFQSDQDGGLGIYPLAHLSSPHNASINGSFGLNSSWHNPSGSQLVALSQEGETSQASAVTPHGPPLFRHSLPMVVVMSILYLVVFVLAVFNNTVVVSVIVKNPHMRNVTNYFLANLAVADITVSFLVLPITLLSTLLNEWIFGEFLCRAMPYIQAVSVSASVYTLVAVALERYFAIFFPHKTIIRPSYVSWIIAIIWFIPMCIQVPWAIYYYHTVYAHPTTGLTYWICFPRFPSPLVNQWFFTGVFLTFYVVPLAFICFCYSLIGVKVCRRRVAGIRGSQTERNIQRAKIRIVRMLVVVAVVFLCSWLPLYSLRMRLIYASQPMDPHEKWLITLVWPVAQWMGSANSCVNPFIYCYFSEQFRREIIAVLGRFRCAAESSPESNGHVCLSKPTQV